MVSLIIGGAASGKSEYAERVAALLPGPRVYLATMRPWDDECRAKIAAHRARRAAGGWQTVECFGSLQQLTLPQNATVLLECMGNLTANLLYGPAPQNAHAALLAGLDHLAKTAAGLVIVTNDVFGDGEAYSAETLRYMDLLAAANRRGAALADTVTQVVCGIALPVKGPLPTALLTAQKKGALI